MMLKGYVSSDSDDLDDMDEFYSEPPVRKKEAPRPLPAVQNEKLREKLNSAMKENEKIHLFLKAADEGDLNTLEELISLGVSVDTVRDKEWTALLKACGAGNFEVVQFLLEHGSNPNLHKELLTPLMVCCNYSLTPESSKLMCARLLLQHGADVNARDKYKTTALMYASESNYEDIVTELLATPGININMQDKEGLTALFYAVHSNSLNIVKKLQLAGIDLTLQDRYERTAITLALENGHEEIAKQLGYVENKETFLQETDTEPNFRFLQQLPNASGEGGFQLDVKHILASLGHKNAKEISFPDFLNVTDAKLYDLGVKLRPHREKILFLVHRYHLHPWTKHSIHEIQPGLKLCTEDAIAITGDIAKHLTLVNASLRYLNGRLEKRIMKKPESTTTDKDLMITLTDIYQTSEKLNILLLKILNHINQMPPEVLDDYIHPFKEKKKKKLPRWLFYTCGVVAIGFLFSSNLSQVVGNIQVEIKSLLDLYLGKPPVVEEDTWTYIYNIFNI